MAGYKNFQVNRNKYKNGITDIYKKEINPNKVDENLSKNERLRNGFKKWTSFFRSNPHRFAESYLGLKLKLYQKILLYLMFHVSAFMYFAARGQGKSYIIAVFCIIRSILYPNTKIVIASGNCIAV